MFLEEPASCTLISQNIGKTNNVKVLGSKKPKGLNRITKIY
jgi:hypothetical protein